MAEEKIKVFDLIKNILRTNNGEKNIFLCGNADFSGDMKQYIAENSVLIFKYIDKIDKIAGGHAGSPLQADLLVLGECGHSGTNIEIPRPGNIKTILLNLDNPGGFNCPAKDVQIITCGLKEKDTVIFSSINLDEGSVILDLQRSIKDINGETLEPFEKQINLSEIIDNIKKEPPKHAGFTTEDLILALSALMFCGRV